MSSCIDAVAENDCVGCASCVATCPTNALSLNFDKQGFFIPVLDTSRCINCEKCLSACPAICNLKMNKPFERYAVQLIDQDALKRSASGSAFFGLAKYVISEESGVVAGCALDHHQIPCHFVAEDLEKLKEMQGSKYAQSRIDSSVFADLQKHFSMGRMLGI